MHDAPALQLTGSTTLLPRMQRIAEAYMATHALRLVINGGCGTMRGYKALLDGTSDIAMASGAVPEHLADLAAARGRFFSETIVTRDALLPLVNGANPLQNLTRLQLRHIFSGRIANWRAVGGPDRPIEVLVGLPTGGVSASWRALLLGDEDTFTPQARVAGAHERLAHVAQQRWAITYIPRMALPTRRLKALRVDGVADDAAPHDYPLRAPMMLVTLGRPAPVAARFIAHAASVGASRQAQAAHE